MPGGNVKQLVSDMRTKGGQGACSAERRTAECQSAAQTGRRLPERKKRAQLELFTISSSDPGLRGIVQNGSKGRERLSPVFSGGALITLRTHAPKNSNFLILPWPGLCFNTSMPPIRKLGAFGGADGETMVLRELHIAN